MEPNENKSFRNRLQRVVSKPIKPQTNESVSTREIIFAQSSYQQQPSNTIPESLPPELVEAILDKIGNSSCLYECRLVCRKWKNIVVVILEKEHLSLWTDLRRDINLSFSFYISNNPICPCLYAVIPKSAKTPLSRIWLPPALNTKLEGNHFPKNAVAIVGFHKYQIAKDKDPLCPIGHRRSKGARSEKVVKVFQSAGQQLTYLTLHDMIIRQETLCYILESTTSLKGLTLSMIVLHNGREERQVNVSKFLEILHLLYCYEDQELVITWILASCSKQLTSLKIVGGNKIAASEYISFENETNLQQLFIFDGSECDLVALLRNSKYPQNLKHATLLWSRFHYRCEGVDEMLKFLAKMPKSLVYLKIHVRFCSLITVLKNCDKILYNVRFIEMFISEIEAKEISYEEISLKKSILQWFPELESVRVIKCSKSLPIHEMLYESVGGR